MPSVFISHIHIPIIKCLYLLFKNYLYKYQSDQLLIKYDIYENFTKNVFCSTFPIREFSFLNFMLKT